MLYVRYHSQWAHQSTFKCIFRAQNPSFALNSLIIHDPNTKMFIWMLAITAMLHVRYQSQRAYQSPLKSILGPKMPRYLP